MDLTLSRGGSNHLFTNDQFRINDGVKLKLKSGTLGDGDFTETPNGLIGGIDDTNGRLYAKWGNTWHFFAEGSGFQIRVEDAWDHLKSPEAKFQKGDLVLGIVVDFKTDGAPHCEYVTLQSALKKLAIDFIAGLVPRAPAEVEP